MPLRSDAPNLVGSPLYSEIVEQFRQRALRQDQTGFRDNVNLLSITNKNCWVRLSSFVSIDASGLPDIKAGTNNEIPIQAGTYLAREWVLKSEQKNAKGPKYGVNSLAGAYGTGGIRELGYRPMPGIQNVSIEAQPPLGLITSATVKIKAWNLNQLSILDLLYFRLGFSMLLEWGHSVFTNNKGVLVTNPIPLDIFSTVGRTLTKAELLSQLAQKREEYSYNYDGSLFLVTNYTWSQAGDGSYDCTLYLTGIGSVIESLKINTQDSMPATTTPIGTAPAQTSTPDDSSLLGFVTGLEQSNYDPYTLFSSGADLLNKPTTAFKYGYNTAYMALPSGTTIPSSILEVDFRNLIVRRNENFYEISKTQTVSTKIQRYVKLGHILAYLNNSCLLYERGEPYIPIDFNPESNYCLRMPEQFSIDPSVCLVDLDCSDGSYTGLINGKAPITGPGGVVNTQGGGVYFSPARGTVAAALATSTGGYIDSTKGKEYRGKFMNIFVSTTCLRETVLECTDKDKNVFLSNFVSTLMKKIQIALGNINNFKIGYNEAANTCYIYDAQLVDYEASKARLPVLPVFGLQSVVREFNLKTEASTKIGSMLAITARAGAVNTGLNTDGTAFTVLNKSLSDRLLLDVTTAANTGSTSQTQAPVVTLTQTAGGTIGFNVTSNGLVDLAANFNTQVNNIYGITTPNAIRYDKVAIESVKNFYIDALLRKKGELIPGTGQGDSVAATGVLPLALNMTVDGIGGIPLYQAFTLPANRLPVQYVQNGQPRIGFTIAGLSHTIENNQWTTSIRGLMINVPSGSRAYTPNFIPKQNTVGSVLGCRFNPCQNPANVSKLYKSKPLYKDARFRAEVARLTTKYSLTDPEALYKVMYAESKLDPKASLVQNGVRKTAGLIQFTNATVPQIIPSLDAVINTSGVDQMKYVEKFFDAFGNKVQGADTFRLYSLVFFPLIANHDNDPNWVVESNTLTATQVSLANPAIACAAGKTPGTPLTVADFRQYVSCIS